MEHEMRIQALEERIAWLERTLSSLDEVVRELATENSRLRREVGELAEQVRNSDERLPEGQVDLAYERPPHY